MRYGCHGALLYWTVDAIVLDRNDLPLPVAPKPGVGPHQAAPLVLAVRQRYCLGFGSIDDRNVSAEKLHVGRIESAVRGPLRLRVRRWLSCRLLIANALWSRSSEVVGKEIGEHPLSATGLLGPGSCLLDNPLSCRALLGGHVFGRSRAGEQGDGGSCY